MARLRDLVFGVMANSPMLPEPAAVNAYRGAAREFFHDTQAWQEEVTAVATAATNEYTLDVPEDSVAFDYVALTYDGGAPIPKITMQQAARGYAGKPRARITAQGSLILYPDPEEDVSDKLSVTAVLRPTLDAILLDDGAAERFHEILEHGALARVLAMPKKEWTDYDAALHHLGLFREAIDIWSSRGTDNGMKGVPRKVKYGGY